MDEFLRIYEFVHLVGIFDDKNCVYASWNTQTHKLYMYNRDGFLSTSGSYENKLCSLFIFIVQSFWELDESKKNIMYSNSFCACVNIKINTGYGQRMGMSRNDEMNGNNEKRKKKNDQKDSLNFFFNLLPYSVSNRKSRPSQRFAIN